MPDAIANEGVISLLDYIYVNRAVDLLEKEQFPKAIEMLENFLEDDAKHIETFSHIFQAMKDIALKIEEQGESPLKKAMQRYVKSREKVMRNILSLRSFAKMTAVEHLGWGYMHGHYGLEQDTKHAQKYYKIGTDGGSADSQYNLAILYDKDGNVDGAVLFLNQCKKNIPDAGNTLGATYLLQSKYKETFENFYLAAKAGLETAEINLKDFFRNKFQKTPIPDKERKDLFALYQKKVQKNGTKSLKKQLEKLREAEEIKSLLTAQSSEETQPLLEELPSDELHELLPTCCFHCPLSMKGPR